MENAGAWAVECEVIPSRLMRELSSRTSLVTISIGSGNGGDVQFLFAEDILGASEGPFPRHSKQYCDLQNERNKMQKMRIKARPSEVFQHLVAMKTTRAYKEPKKKSDTLKRTAATVGGAYVGSKVIPKLTKGKLGSKTGAGIGAIAGYWASGRKKL